MSPLTWLYPAIVSILQTVAIFSPAYSDMFRGSGQSAAFFTIALITAHWALFWKGLKPFPVLMQIPIQVVMQLTVIIIAPYIIPDIVAELQDDGYFGIWRSFFSQAPISLVVAIGMWIKKKYEKFQIRRAALDHEEQMKLYKFRMEDSGDLEIDFFKYSSLLSRSLTVVGVLRNDIQASVSGLRIDDTLYIYDHFVSTDCKEFDIDRQVIEKLVNRPEILTTPIKDLIIILRNSSEKFIEGYRSLGFTDVEDSQQINEIQERLNGLLRHKYESYAPFNKMTGAMHYTLPKINE